MGLLDGTMAKDADDSSHMGRRQQLTQKMNEGTITDAERDELAKLQDIKS